MDIYRKQGDWKLKCTLQISMNSRASQYLSSNPTIMVPLISKPLSKIPAIRSQFIRNESSFEYICVYINKRRDQRTLICHNKQLAGAAWEGDGRLVTELRTRDPVIHAREGARSIRCKCVRSSWILRKIQPSSAHRYTLTHSSFRDLASAVLHTTTLSTSLAHLPLPLSVIFSPLSPSSLLHLYIPPPTFLPTFVHFFAAGRNCTSIGGRAKKPHLIKPLNANEILVKQ